MEKMVKIWEYEEWFDEGDLRDCNNIHEIYELVENGWEIQNPLVFIKYEPNEEVKFINLLEKEKLLGNLIFVLNMMGLKKWN